MTDTAKTEILATVDQLNEIVDSNNNIHRIKKVLGRGGQGVVFETYDADIAIKLVTDQAGQPLKISDPGERVKYNRKIDYVRTLPILSEIKISKPLSTLKDPYVGYVMKLLQGMIPLDSMIAPSGTDIAEYYLKTGGLRRRYEVLSRAAQIFSIMHSIPLVYSDVSPNNIFYSSDADFNEVWLIDSDNLRYQSGRSNIIYTPRYGAPELVNEISGVNTLSDIYAFAVMSFKILAQVHPFLGKYVEEGEWDDASSGGDDREAMAYKGKISWIEEPSDDSNRTTNGIPRNFILNYAVRELFNATFGPGRNDPGARPSMSDWHTRFLQAADLTIKCLQCGMTFFANFGKYKLCPSCDSKLPGYLFISVYRWDPEFDIDGFDPGLSQKIVNAQNFDQETIQKLRPKPLWYKFFEVGKNTECCNIKKHIVAPIITRDDNKTAVKVEFSDKFVKLSPAEGAESIKMTLAVKSTNKIIEFNNPVTINLSSVIDGIYLHCGPIEEPHRVMTLKFNEGDHI